MLKELFPFVFVSDESPAQQPAAARNAVPEPVAVPALELGLGRFSSFEDVYRSAPVKASRVSYSILKIADMAASEHLAGMSGEAKRGSLLMALEAAGVNVEDVLQDAMVRQRALNDYEDAQQKKLKEFEAGKADENGRIQAELDRVTGQYMARIQANLDEVARQQDLFRAWQKQKQHEARRISDAAAICVPQAPPVNGDNLSLMLERVALPRR